MADHEEESRKVQYPLDPKSYKILNEIGRGASAVVYKALCIPLNSSVVAIKSIDLDQSKADLDNVRREAKTVSLLSHPNILKAHCSFTVERRLWVVMPFMSAGSLQSIINSTFPGGLSEACMAVILKETLRALSYLHDQGHLHRDVKAGNILMDSDGAVKLADFGVSASIYESTPSSSFGGSCAASCSKSLMLTDVAGTPYWMAPEVIHSHIGYSFKADIWSFGITAMELAHGRPPLSHLPPSKSLLMRITKQFRFSDYENNDANSKKKKFSKYFKEMIGLCLDQDPSKRPSAHKLLKNSFFRHCKGTDFLVSNLLHSSTSVEQRFLSSMQQQPLWTGSKDVEEEEEEIAGENEKQRRISGWNFNLEDFQLSPIFPTETEDDGNDCDVVKQVRFGGETFIQDNGTDSDASTASNSGQVVPENQNQNQNQLFNQPGDGSNDSVGSSSCTGFLNHQEIMLKSLFSLKRSFEDQHNMVMKITAMLTGKRSTEISREEQLIMSIEKLKKELDAEKKKNSELALELEFLKMQFSNE